VRAASARSRQYALYVRGDGDTLLALELPAGEWRAEWLDPRAGRAIDAATFRHEGGRRELRSPRYDGDVALRLTSPAP
jgi:hypothetical protein